MKIKEQECQVGKIATIHRGVLTEKLVIFTHLFAAATHTVQAHTHTYIHTYILQSTYMVFTFTRQHSVAAVRRRRQLLKRKGESKISECVCAQCYLLDSYVYVCPHAIFYALLNFFLSNFYRDILLQTIHNIWQNRL